MSKLTGNPQGIEFLNAQVAQSVGEYYEILQECELAKEEYQNAIALYDRVPDNSPDFSAAQTHRRRVNEALKKLGGQYSAATPGRLTVNLSRWLKDLKENAEYAWQALETILEPRRVEFAYGPARGADTARRGKILEFELPLEKRSVALIINLKPGKNKEEMDVTVKLLPQDERTYLPLGLILKVTLNPGTSSAKSQEVTATGKEEGIQLGFEESVGKLVKIEVAWGDRLNLEEIVV